MTSIMTDTSPSGMVAAIETAMEGCFMFLAASSTGEARVENGIALGFTGFPIPDFNGVFRTRLDPDLTDEQIDARIGTVTADLQSRGVPFGWMVMPSDLPADLRQRLPAFGFAFEHDTPAMAVDLALLRDAPVVTSDLTIEEVRDPEGMVVFAHTAVFGYGMPPQLEAPFRDLLLSLPLWPRAPIRYFLARRGGEPVATSLVTLVGGAAGIFNVATVPDARRGGIGAAVTTAALRAARAEGYRIAILESSSMGYGVYQRMGFAEYCKLGHYTWHGVEAS